MGIFKNKYHTEGANYTIPQVDLSKKNNSSQENMDDLFTLTTVADNSGYLGHPDSVLLKNGDILTFYPEGHGKGKVIGMISIDGGKTYTKTIKNPPKSWEKSKETPTVYRLEFSDHNWDDKLVLVCGNPKWPGEVSTGGFNFSLSNDEGETWSEFKLLYSKKDEKTFYPVVAMSSLTRLKENGKFVDKWMGLFHESTFVNYKTILTFDDNGNAQWSEPKPYFSKYRAIEKASKMCEVECVRSDNGTGDEICLITRSNCKKINSLLSFSSDEGETWSQPVEAPAALNGERHKAEYTKDGRLFITFRSIERDKEKYSKYREKALKGRWYSEGWVAWVGTYDDLKNHKEGQYRIKIAHTYLSYQNEPAVTANADTGYCGNVVLDDGTIVTSSYGIFDTKTKDGGTYVTDKGLQKRKTYIVSKRINLNHVEKLL